MSRATARDPIRVPDQVESYLREQHPATADVALWTCRAVAAADPDLTPRVYRGWQGIGFRHTEAGYVCGVFPKGGSVELLFERGASMADPEGVLIGEGTQTRLIRVDGPSDELAGVIVRYVQQAIAERLLGSK
jgi:hypothetical protein